MSWKNKTYEVKGTIKSIESFTSMVVFDIVTDAGRFSYTAIGSNNLDLSVNDEINVVIGYSSLLNAYVIKYLNINSKVA